MIEGINDNLSPIRLPETAKKKIPRVDEIASNEAKKIFEEQKSKHESNHLNFNAESITLNQDSSLDDAILDIDDLLNNLSSITNATKQIANKNMINTIQQEKSNESKNMELIEQSKKQMNVVLKDINLNIKESNLINKFNKTTFEVIDSNTLIDNLECKLNETKSKLSEKYSIEIHDNVVFFKKAEIEKDPGIKRLQEELQKKIDHGAEEVEIDSKILESMNFASLHANGKAAVPKELLAQHPHIKHAVIVDELPAEWRDKINEIDLDNPPPGVKTYEVEAQTDEDAQEIKKLVRDYLVFSTQIHIFNFLSQNQNTAKAKNLLTDEKQRSPETMANTNISVKSKKSESKPPLQKNIKSATTQNRDIKELVLQQHQIRAIRHHGKEIEEKISSQNKSKRKDIDRNYFDLQDIHRAQDEELIRLHTQEVIHSITQIMNNFDIINPLVRKKYRLSANDLNSVKEIIESSKAQIEGTVFITVLEHVYNILEKQQNPQDVVLTEKLGMLVKGLKSMITPAAGA